MRPSPQLSASDRALTPLVQHHLNNSRSQRVLWLLEVSPNRCRRHTLAASAHGLRIAMDLRHAGQHEPTLILLCSLDAGAGTGLRDQALPARR